MDDLRDRLARMAEQAARRARAPGATLTLRRAQARRRWAARALTLSLVLVLVLGGLTARLLAERDRPGAVATARQATPLWTAAAAVPGPVADRGRGPEATANLLLAAGGSQGPGRVRAFDARVGKQRWTHQLGPTASLWAAGDRHVIVTADRGPLVALALATGEELWRFPLAPGQTPEHGTIVGGRLYIGASFPGEADVRAPVVYALDLATGRQRWRAVLDPGTDLQWGAPVVEHGLVLVADTLSHPGSAPTSHLHALDAGSGRVRWKADLHASRQGFHYQRPVVAGGLVYQASTEGTLLALDAASGRAVWRERRGPILPLLVGATATLVVAVLEDSLVALDAGTGEQRWEVPAAGGPGEAQALLAGDTAYLVGGGRALAVSASSGAERWRAAVGRAVGPPVKVGERVYVAATDRLFALDAASGDVRWASGRLAIVSGPVATPGAVAITTRDGALLGFAL